MTYKIDYIELPLKLEKRLSALGMIVGTEVTVLSKKPGALVVKVRGTRFALGSDITEHITVEG